MSDLIGIFAGITNCLHGCVHILRTNRQHHADSHVVGVVHHMLVDIAFFLHQFEDREHRIGVLLNFCVHAVAEHTGNILVKTAAGDMTAALNSDAGLFDALERFYIDLCRCKKNIAQSSAEFVIIGVQ